VVTPSALALAEHDAQAQSEEDLEKARKKFAEAFEKEQKGEYLVALEMFREVAQVKESAQVRYRIATCSEKLNRLREARDAYRACAAMKSTLPPAQQNVADACAEKALAVDKKVPKIIVTISGENPPADAKVTVDGAPVPTGRPIEQDPGEHTVQGSAKDMKPFEQKVTLPDNGSAIPATVTFEPLNGTPACVGENCPCVGEKCPKTGKPKTLSWILIGGGAALMVTGVALLFVREGSIDDIKSLCGPRGTGACDPNNADKIHDKEDSANLLLPVGVGFAVVGAAVAGFGVYTLVKKSPPPPSDPNQQPAQGSATSRIDIGPRYVRGGGMLGLSGTF
jgi:hypothetical protein